MEWVQIIKCTDGVIQNDYTYGVYNYSEDDGWDRLLLKPNGKNDNGIWYVLSKDTRFVLRIKNA